MHVHMKRNVKKEHDKETRKVEMVKQGMETTI